MIETRRITSRDEWLAWRQADVTASDVAPVLGLHPTRTAMRVWAEKTGLISPEPQTEFLEYRLALEAAAIDWLKMKRPRWTIRRGGVYVRDPDLRLGATPDAMAVDPDRPGIGIIECKSVVRHVFERDWQQRDGIAEAPIFHQLQALTGAMLTGASWAMVVALILDNAGTGGLALAPMDRHEGAESRIRDGVARFWALTEAGHSPPISYERDTDVLAALFPKALIKEPPLDLSQDNRLPDILQERKNAKAMIRSAEKKCKTIDAEIMEKMTTHECGTLPGYRIFWKTQRRKEHIVPEWEGRVLRVISTKQQTTEDGND